MNQATVTVIVPAYNAELTIDETLASIRAQSYKQIEIIVVNDGSTDNTVRLVEVHMQADPRVRLVHQKNEGVAAARNRGIQEAAGHYVAPIDADDLWHPQKIEWQMRAFQEHPDVGLVCTLYSVIDENSLIIAEQAGSQPASYGFTELCRRNFIGNGSSALMRRDAVLALDGYDCSLRLRNAQGCEDLKLYLQLSEHAGLLVVPLPLTGYRQLPHNMSSDGHQMLRSFDAIAQDFCSRRADLIKEFRQHRYFLLRWLISRAISGGRWRLASGLIWEMRGSPLLLGQSFILAAGRLQNRVTRLLLPKAMNAQQKSYSDLNWH